MGGMSFARDDGRIFQKGERVLMDRYPQQSALQARVISHCLCCQAVELYEVNAQVEESPFFEPACVLITAEEWGAMNNPDWPEDDGWEAYVEATAD